MKTFCTAILLIVGWGLHCADLGRVRRESFVDEMNDESDHWYIATGTLSRTLVLVTLQKEPVPCDAFVSEMVWGADFQEVRDELLKRGFDALQCGNTKKSIPKVETHANDSNSVDDSAYDDAVCDLLRRPTEAAAA